MQMDKTNEAYESNAKAKALAELQKLREELAEAEVADSAADADVVEARKLVDTAELRVNLVSLSDVDQAQAKADLRGFKEALEKARNYACATGAEVSEVQKLVEIQELRMDVVFLSAVCTGTDPIKDRIIELGVVGENGGELLSLRFNPGVPIPPSTTHTITDRDVEQLPLFETCIDALFGAVKKKKVVVFDKWVTDLVDAELAIAMTGNVISEVSQQPVFASEYFRPKLSGGVLAQAHQLRENYLALLIA